MYASIRHYGRAAGSVAGLISDGRRLTSAVNELPGFVAYALLDAGDGLLVSVTIFDDQAGLAAADRLVHDWIPATDATRPAVPEIISGEVIIQKGL